MNLIDPFELHHIVMSVLCRKLYVLESDSLPYLLLYKRTYLDVCTIGRTQRSYILTILSCRMANENSSVTLFL